MSVRPHVRPGELVVHEHISGLDDVLAALSEAERLIADWGVRLANRLRAGGKLLTAGNGGSAAEAQHFAAEIVGRFDGERRPYAAIALTADTAALTAIANDYSYEEVFARQVRAHTRAGDIVGLFSTSGRSPNLLRAAEVARELGAETWAFTGPRPNPLADACDEALSLAGRTPNVQEGHLVAVHALCRATEEELQRSAGAS